MGEGQEVGRLGVIYLKLPQVGQFLNMRSGPYHLNIRPELVFHTTSNPGVGGPATTYLNVVTVSQAKCRCIAHCKQTASHASDLLWILFPSFSTHASSP